MSYKIKLVDQDVSFEVSNDESILDAALRQQVGLPYGCRNGACGACKAKLIEGQVCYPNDKLPPALKPEEHEQGSALLCQARAVSNVTLKARTIDSAADIKTRKLPCRVTACEKLSDDVIRLFLDLPKTERLQFLAGQYIDILMRGDKRRSFSMANPPHKDQQIELHVRYYNGGLFSEYAFHDLKKSALMRIEGPLGSFTLQESERPTIMIAGGTGFAPIKSLIEHALHTNDKREINLYWGVRTEADLYLHDMAQKWADEYKQIHYVPVLSEQDESSDWQGKTGFVHEAILQDYEDLSGYDVYACGPPPMINAVVETLPSLGLKKDRIFSDSFEFATN
jgi:CDP-4-dehydro-6-deoxyglucose reductase